MMSGGEDPRLTRVSKICLSLPEAVRSERGDYSDFRVRKKVFAYFLANHHGDGIVSVCAKLAPGANRDLAQEDPGRFYLPAYIAVHGYVGVRLDVDPVDWAEIRELVTESYRRTAPKTLVRRTYDQPL